mmetsp:Transcript_3482/g.5338  ORF Transcript_3482/g.5338 Transcript_3482/m.5338 type:complete len:472 (-) Transcript_3482:49-1464(-)
MMTIRNSNLSALTVLGIIVCTGGVNSVVEDSVSSNGLQNMESSLHDYSYLNSVSKNANPHQRALGELTRYLDEVIHVSDDHDHDHDDDHDDDHDERNGEDHPWQEIMLATLLVNLVTLAGVVFLIPAVSKAAWNVSFCASFKTIMSKKEQTIETPVETKRKAIFDIALTSFACGAIMASAVFLIIPESINLLNGGHSDEHEGHEGHGDEGGDEDIEDHDDHDESGVAWKFGVGFLGGFLLPIFLGALFPRYAEHECDDDCVEGPQIDTTLSTAIPEESAEITHKCGNSTGEEAIDDITDEENQTDSNGEKNVITFINYRLCCSVLVGDFFHNFADGIFIGTAFTLCSRSIAYTIVFSTIYHEIAQEIADFFLLVNHGGLSPIQALGVNFVSGLSVLLGGIIVLAINPGNTSVGVILALSAGVYIHLAAGECLPRADKLLSSGKDRLISLSFFILGATPIGLVLLNHGHCEE